MNLKAPISASNTVSLYCDDDLRVKFIKKALIKLKYITRKTTKLEK